MDISEKLIWYVDNMPDWDDKINEYLCNEFLTLLELDNTTYLQLDPVWKQLRAKAPDNDTREKLKADWLLWCRKNMLFIRGAAATDMDITSANLTDFLEITNEQDPEGQVFKSRVKSQYRSSSRKSQPSGNLCLLKTKFSERL